MNKKNKLILSIYTLILFSGGIIGYFKSHSLMSLITSCGFSIAFIFLMTFHKKITKSVSYSSFLLIFLDSFFTYRFLKTWKVMPSLALAVLTFCTVILFIKSSDPLQNKARRAP
jgi:uncharacterized membrane protein (UPF0136 family)